MRNLGLAIALILGIVTTSAADEPKPLKAGIIGLDTSHVVAFTQLLNDPKAAGDLAGIRVVAAFPAGSKDIESSRSRIDGFTKTLKEKFNVEIVGSIDELLGKVDVILLESVDGRPHLEQARPVIKAKKPLFIDKPVAGNLADAIEIYDLAKANNVPVFSSSSLRFYPNVAEVRTKGELGDILGCDTRGPCSLEEHHPDLYWYGIHGVETLYTIMGPGCETVTRVHNKGTDFVTGTWKDGRVGTFRGIRAGKADYGINVLGSKGNASFLAKGSYQPLVVEICKFFRSGKPPVSAEETLELMTFMEAADESKRQNGAPVKLADVFAKAKARKK
jgi:predicted dehydrogenase